VIEQTVLVLRTVIVRLAHLGILKKMKIVSRQFVAGYRHHVVNLMV